MPHPLDNPIWHALTSVHARFALGSGLARRYPAAIGPLAGLRDQSAEAYGALAGLLKPHETAVLFLDEPPRPPQGWELVTHFLMDQLVQTRQPLQQMQPPQQPQCECHPLGIGDVPEMIALAKLTEPGPFRERTIEYGGYLGIRVDGRLAAMTGQRVSMPGWTEVSAVCTHPDFRGRGYGAALVCAVADGISARGETPFLEVRQGNDSAKRLYGRVSFETRRELHLAVVKPPASRTRRTVKSAPTMD